MKEWLSKIDVDTTYEDVLTRPSSFNPYPEHADDGLEVWAVESPTANPLYTIRYPKIDAGCRVVLPISHEESQDLQGHPELLEGSDINGGYQAVEAANLEHWMPLSDFWDGMSVSMASAFLIHEGYSKGGFNKLIDLIVSNADETAEEGFITPEPRPFVRKAVALAQQEIQAGNPEVGYAIAEDMFRGFSTWRDGYQISNGNTMSWTSDGLPALLFPNFVEPWKRKLNPHIVSTVAHPYEIGRTAATIAKNKLTGLAVDAWLEDSADDHSEAVSEKVEGLQKRIARRTITAEAQLGVKLDEASRQFQEATVDDRGHLTWQIPHPLGNYVMGIISSAD